jgi:hypothetical protein
MFIGEFTLGRSGTRADIREAPSAVKAKRPRIGAKFAR